MSAEPTRYIRVGLMRGTTAKVAAQVVEMISNSLEFAGDATAAGRKQEPCELAIGAMRVVEEPPLKNKRGMHWRLSAHGHVAEAGDLSITLVPDSRALGSWGGFTRGYVQCEVFGCEPGVALRGHYIEAPTLDIAKAKAVLKVRTELERIVRDLGGAIEWP